MATKIINFEVERGDSFTRTINFSVDITGDTIFFTIKKKEDDSETDAKVKKDIVTHVTTKQTKIEVSAAEVHDLVGKHYYDAQWKTAAGKIRTLFKGTITFGKDITRRIA